MNHSPRLKFTPHLLRVRTPNGDALEVDLPPIMQAKLAVKYAYRLARFLVRSVTADVMGEDWEIDARDDIEDLEADPLECTVEVFRRVPEGYLGAVHGYAVLLEVPVQPGIPIVNPDALNVARPTERGSQ